MIILLLLAYYLSSEPVNDNIMIQHYMSEIYPNLDTPYIICILKHGIGNRMNCLGSSIILSRYLNIPLYVVWTDVDMGTVQLSDIWTPPYPFTVLDTIPTVINSSYLSHVNQYKLFDDNHISQLNDKYGPFLSNGIADLKSSETPIMVFNTYWNFKHPNQSISDFYSERQKIFSQELIPVAPINERIQRYQQLFDEHTFGAHIRLTDSCMVLWGNQEKCEKLAFTIKNNIQKLLDSDQNRKVFLCTDDQEYINDLIIKYGSRIIVPDNVSRFTVEGQHEAYAEIIALSTCNPLLLTLRSTFSSGVASLTHTDQCIFYSPIGEYPCK